MERAEVVKELGCVWKDRAGINNTAKGWTLTLGASGNNGNSSKLNQ